jgi:hypothetical protein
MKAKTFKIKIQDNEVEFLVKTPSINDQREAQKIYNQAFTDAIKSKCVVRAKMDDLLEEQGLWNQDKQIKFNKLQQDILDSERKLAKGGISLKEARNIAIQMKRDRDEIRSLIAVRTSLDNHSAEGQADNARFNYLVSVCLVYNNVEKQPYFNNMEDYLNRSNEEVAIVAAQHLASMLYGLDNDYELNLPENKFLKKYKFIDDKLRYINKEGKLTDADGRLVDENGRYVDEQGNFVDKFGNRVDKDGEYVVETQPFLDDDGQPVILDEDKKDEPTPQPILPASEPVTQSTESAKATPETPAAVSETVVGT